MSTDGGFRVHSLAAGRRPAQPRSGRNGPVESLQVHPAVWAAALRLAGGDALRLRVASPTVVYVANGRRAG